MISEWLSSGTVDLRRIALGRNKPLSPFGFVSFEIGRQSILLHFRWGFRRSSRIEALHSHDIICRPSSPDSWRAPVIPRTGGSSSFNSSLNMVFFVTSSRGPQITKVNSNSCFSHQKPPTSQFPAAIPYSGRHRGNDLNRGLERLIIRRVFPFQLNCDFFHEVSCLRLREPPGYSQVGEFKSIHLH